MSNTGKAFNVEVFRRLYQLSSSYRKGFYLTLILVMGLAGMVWIRPDLTRDMLDDALPHRDITLLHRLVIWFLVLLAFEALIQYVQTQVANRVAQSITLDLREALFKHISKFKLSYFDRTPVGQSVTRLISDIDGIADVFSSGLLDIFRDILKLIVIIGFMFYLDWKMTLVIIIPIPILLYATRIFQRAVKNSFQDVRNEVASINTFIQEHVSGMSVVQLFNRELREEEKFKSINQRHRDAHIRGIWAYSIFFPIVELLSAASVALMIWWGLGSGLAGETTPGTLLEFSTFITMMYRPIRQMADNFNVLQMGMVNGERVFKLLDMQEEQLDTGKIDAQQMRGHVQFEDVHFGYDPAKPVLQGINLDVKQGEMLALVGPTGAGKTSIIGLLNRLYEHQSGRISIDGKSIQDYSLSSLRRHVVMVTQDVFLFNDTVFNNITLHDESITREDVLEAAKRIGADDFIQSLPKNYDHVVQERGTSLSVGQRQLIAFVRAYVQKPEILILDEATSSVDSESEFLIQHATSEVTKGRTSIVIAHRLSTIRNAHHVALIDGGEVAEYGTHEELIARGGQYKRLYDLQFQDIT